MRKINYVIIFLLATTSLHAQNKDILDVKIGQMLMIGLSKADVEPLLMEEVRAGKVGGILIFEKSIPKSSSSFAPLKKIIWSYQKAAPIPLMVAIDQEGGKVNRLKEKYGFTRSITASDMGKANSLDSVRFYSEATAATLAGMGFNINFAPVVDVAVNPANTVIVKPGRSFSANPDSVVLFAEEFIKPHRKFGVTTVLKHFPGHGSSMEDTHFGVADVTKAWTASELIPYQKLLAAGAVDAIMSAHIVNKQLDPKGYPGTLSSRMIDSLLRKQLHYDGVVFSDDMQMHAITKQYGLEESIKLAINAGIDVLCFSNNIQGSEERTVTKVHSIIRKLVDSGQIKTERIDEAFSRILKLKSRLGSNPEEFLRRELDATRQELAELKKAPEQKMEVKEQKKEVNQITTPAEEQETKKKKKKKS
ncbi:glycoside hydrolase family 3 protein [soil metagenome]